jgi:hypothetical protein
MREPVTLARLHSFMHELGRRVRRPARVVFAGGATALLCGWRTSTIDVDCRFFPDDEILPMIQDLKRELRMNIELASPADFVPQLSLEESRDPFIAQHGVVTFCHYDFYGQALAKLERGFEQDLADAGAMAASGLVDPEKLQQLFSAVESELWRYPAVDRDHLARAIEAYCQRHRRGAR